MRIQRIALLAIVPAVLGLAACGSSSGNDKGVASVTSGAANASGPASAGPTLSARDAQLKYAQCLRENGINVQDPDPGKGVMLPSNADQGKVAQANQKCIHYLQQGGGLPNPDDPAVRDSIVKFAQCMRAHGVNVPDPQPGQGGMLQVPDNAGSNAQFQAAQQACQKYLPGLPGGGQ